MLLRSNSIDPCSLFPGLRLALAAVLALTALLHVNPLQAAVFTVGADGQPTCTHDTLQGALLATFVNGPGFDVIRLSNDLTYTGEYVIENQSVGIVGGFSSCADTTPSGRTTVSREFDERNFRIDGTVNGPQSVELTHLDVNFSGSVTAILDEGGAIQLRDGHLLTLKNTNVGGGRSTYGGGIWMDGGSSLVLLDGSSLVDNRASFAGGGVFCTGSGTVGLFSAAVALNEAEDGAGVSVDGGCTLNHFAGGFLQGIFQNVATGHGGGIHAINGATVNLIGSAGRSPYVVDNEAAFGGGLAVRGPGTVAFLDDSTLASNDATTQGGGAWVDDFGSFIMDRTTDGPCFGAPRCSQLTGNTVADGSGFGGGLYVGLDANASILRTFVEDNVAAFGSAGFVDDGHLYLEGSQLTGNRGNSTIQVFGSEGGSFEGLYLTAAGNPAEGPAVSSFISDGSAEGGSIALLSSIVWQQQVVGSLTTGSTTQWDCLIVTDDFTVSGGTNVIEADPRFVNSGVGDYRLMAGSPAIDYCDDFYTPGASEDLAGNPRGVDDPDHPDDPLGPFDLGAFEGAVGADPVIFADGFETGDTSRWSTTVN